MSSRRGAVVSAGPFRPWVAEMREAIAGTAEANVPCGECTACCTSSQFIHVGPDETDTLRHIPAALLFPAPRRPAGHMLMGFDQRGHCPMLHDGACSIYAHRPRTCRTYDCRVFAATGVDVTHDDKPAIAARAASWQFTNVEADDEVSLVAMGAAAQFLRVQRNALGEGLVPPTATHTAVAAFEIHELFVDRDAHGSSALIAPSIDDARAALVALRLRRAQDQ
jgi:uncharacterized protein